MKHLEHPSLHPSWLALDRHALGASRPDVAAHLATCEACRARLAPPATDASVAPWARGLGPRPRWFSWPEVVGLRSFGVGVAALACIALIWTVAGRSVERPFDDGYVGTKGSPEVWLYLKRGERVEVWNGSQPIAPGDLLRLEVHPDRFKYVSVFAAAKIPGAYVRLYDAPLSPGKKTAVPLSWKVDAEPGDETLVVVLGATSVSPSQVADVLLHESDRRHWSRRLTLVKTVAKDGGTP